MAKKKIKLALIFGGTSEERKVSIESAKNVSIFLDKSRYDITPIEISRNGKLPFEKLKNIDVAFLALHGPGGEDGTVQGMLESLRVKYTGSGVLASALAMNKEKTKRLVATFGVLVARSQLLRKGEKVKIGLPLVVKPNRLGSSIGTQIVKRKQDLNKALSEAFKHDQEVLVEEFIKGREFTVPILGNENLMPLPVIEIVPKISEFFDFKAKYEIGGTDEIVPAPIPKSLSQKLQTIAQLVHQTLGCRGVTRSDFIVTDRGETYFLEINTIPGMTANSLVPKSAKAAGMSYPQLLDRLINLALKP